MTPPRFTVVGTDGTFVSYRAPLREDGTVDDTTRSEAQRRDGLHSAKLLVRQESRQQREAWIEAARQDLKMARRIALEDAQPVGIRELARQLAEYIEPRLNAALAIAEREG